MKYWAPLLHIYQPPTQEVDVLKRINNECYMPLFKMLRENNYAKISLNINAVLIDLLNDFGFSETIEELVYLVNMDIVEIVGTAKFHPLLPLIQEKEIHRQIKLNEETNKRIFGKNFQKLGFFPPEMAISKNVLKIIADSGYKWVIASGIACPDEWPVDKIYKTSDGLKIFFRDDFISNEISFRKINAEQFIQKIKGLYNEKEHLYIITAMDGETFGHHIRNYEKDFLEKALQMANNDPEIKNVFISDLMRIFPTDGMVQPKDSSWSTTEGDLEENIPYPLWKHPNNPVHKIQYRMLKNLESLIDICEQEYDNLVLNPKFKEKYTTARWFFDRSLYSCPMWWASMRPSWDPTLIYKGANLMLLSALNAQLALIEAGNSRGDEIYDSFIDYHHRLLVELTKQTANLLHVRTF